MRRLLRAGLGRLPRSAGKASSLDSFVRMLEPLDLERALVGLLTLEAVAGESGEALPPCQVRLHQQPGALGAEM